MLFSEIAPAFYEQLDFVPVPLIESTLEAAGGVQKRAAELLHIKPTTLNEMIKRYDIRPRRRRAGGEHDSVDENGNGNGASVDRAPQPAGSRRIASAGIGDE